MTEEEKRFLAKFPEPPRRPKAVPMLMVVVSEQFAAAIEANPAGLRLSVRSSDGTTVVGRHVTGRDGGERVLVNPQVFRDWIEAEMIDGQPRYRNTDAVEAEAAALQAEAVKIVLERFRKAKERE